MIMSSFIVLLYQLSTSKFCVYTVGQSISRLGLFYCDFKKFNQITLMNEGIFISDS